MFGSWYWEDIGGSCIWVISRLFSGTKIESEWRIGLDIGMVELGASLF